MNRRSFVLWVSLWSVWAIAYLWRPVIANDLWWHLASGRWIFQTLSIPSVDPFSWTCFGRQWTDFEWMHQVVSYACFTLGGIPCVEIVKISLIAGITSFVALRLKSLEADGWTSFLGAVLVFLAGRSGWSERPELWSLFYIAWLCYDLARMEKVKARHGWIIGKWIPLFWVWANFHPAFALGLGLLLLFSLVAWVDGRSPRKPLLMAFVGCTLATLATPKGPEVFHAVVREVFVVHAGAVTLTEYLPPPFKAMALFWGVLTSSGILLGLDLWVRPRSVPITRIILTLGLGYLASRYARFSAYFLVVTLPWSIVSLWYWVPGRILRPLALGLPALLTLAVTASDGLPFQTGLTPALKSASEAEQFILKNGLGSRLFNEYNLGSHLVWTFAGNPGVFIDGRSITVEGYGSLNSEIEAARTHSPLAWDAFLERHQIQTALVRYPTPLSEQSVFERYFPREKWALVYWDDDHLVFLRVKGTRLGAATPVAFFIRPDVSAKAFENWFVLQNETIQRQIRAELQLNVERHPTSWRTQAFLARIAKNP